MRHSLPMRDFTRPIRRFDDVVALRLLGASLVALLLAIVEEALGQRGLVTPPHRELESFFRFGNWFLASSLLGSFLIYASARADRRAVFQTAMVGLSLDAGIGLARRAQEQHPAVIAMNFGAGLGVAAIAASALRVVRETGGDETARVERLATLFASALIPTFIVLARALLDLTIALHPTTYDAFLLLADSSFKVQPSFTVGRWLGTSGPLHAVILFIYVQLPLAFSIVYALRAKTTRPRFELLAAFVVAGLIGCAVYHAFPAVGPKPMSGEAWPNVFPVRKDLSAGLVVAPPFFRNCIPSLHTTWALFLVWYSRPLAMPVRIFSATWLALTLIATLGLGEHYFVDLVIAVPFALGVRALTASDVPRRASIRKTALTLGAALFGAWLIVLRFEIETISQAPTFMVGAALATVATGAIVEHRLEASRSV